MTNQPQLLGMVSIHFLFSLLLLLQFYIYSGQVSLLKNVLKQKYEIKH